MARTPSNMLPLGTKAPHFELWDTCSQSYKSLDQLRGTKGTVVLFICNHCPYVVHVNPILTQIAKIYQSKGIQFIAISSNDALQYPEDGPEQMQKQAKNIGYPFPYLYDETQAIAKAYEAACTPDCYVFDHNLSLVYRGQLDDSRPGNQIPVSGDDLEHALKCLLQNITNQSTQKPSLGCNIKWKD